MVTQGNGRLLCIYQSEGDRMKAVFLLLLLLSFSFFFIFLSKTNWPELTL